MRGTQAPINISGVKVNQDVETMMHPRFNTQNTTLAHIVDRSIIVTWDTLPLAICCVQLQREAI